jgi:hypothetical protein
VKVLQKLVCYLNIMQHHNPEDVNLNFCHHDKEPLGSIKGEEFLEPLKDSSSVEIVT